MKVKVTPPSGLWGDCGCAVIIIALAIAISFDKVLDVIRIIFD